MIPHNKLTLSSEEKLAMNKVYNSGWIAQGKEVKLFENEVCNFLGLPEGHAIAVSSCSMAMFVSLTILGANKKSVGLPVYVSRVLRGAISTVGGREVLFDINKENPNINLNEINKNPPQFLIVPHMYGIPVDLSEIKKTVVIENCAHCFGGVVKGIPTGLQKEVGVLSFQATKLITTGGMGGMIISKNKDFIKEARGYRDFDESRNHTANLNVKITDIQASMGRIQLKKLKTFIKKRAKIYEIYKNEGLNLLGADLNKGIEPVRYRAVVKTKNVAEIIKRLDKKNIKSIIPIEDWELLGHKNKFKNAYAMTQRTISLPIYPRLNLEDASKIAKFVKKIQ